MSLQDIGNPGSLQIPVFLSANCHAFMGNIAEWFSVAFSIVSSSEHAFSQIGSTHGQKAQSTLLLNHPPTGGVKKRWVHAFFKGISAKLNTTEQAINALKKFKISYIYNILQGLKKKMTQIATFYNFSIYYFSYYELDCINLTSV